MDDLTSLRVKRAQTLIGTWNCIRASNKVFADFKLADPLVGEVVEHYVSDYQIIKARYKITERIQLHKIAGLMGASILRYRPVVPLLDAYTVREQMYANEYLAIIHGLAICGQLTSDSNQMALMEEPWFSNWMTDFLFFLHCRHFTAEGLIFIFETVSALRFPQNLGELDS